MKRVGTIAVCLAGGFVLSASLRADDAVLPGNPYAIVVARNIFGLNPPVAVDPNAKAVEPPVKVVPNGIMSIFGQLQVLFKVAAAKPGEKDASYILTEGQSQDDIEVTKIDEKAGIVTFNNHGIVQELPLVVTPPTSTPAMAIAGGAPGVPGTVPGFAPGGSPGSPFNNRFGNRGGQNSSNPSGGNNSGNQNNGSGLRNVPTRNNSYNQQPAIDPAVQTVLIEANRAVAQQKGDPSAKLYPITELTPPPNSGD